jgi:YHS domain-containing protein
MRDHGIGESVIVRDPVCGEEIAIDTAFHSHYNGEIYYFCSIEDKRKFDLDPEAYIAPEEHEPTRDEEYE